MPGTPSSRREDDIHAAELMIAWEMTKAIIPDASKSSRDAIHEEFRQNLLFIREIAKRPDRFSKGR